MNILIVGAGAIGKERIKALETIGGHKIKIIDPEVVLEGYDCYKSFWGPINVYDIDYGFICTPHDMQEEACYVFNKMRIDFLVEKPLGRTVKEYEDIIKFRTESEINVGFNYRFYKGVRQLLTDCQNKLFGDLISVNMVLALGDAPGSEKTWRLDPNRAGRGAILDPGIHLIDLAMLISNNTLKQKSNYNIKDLFWKTGIYEESHLLAIDKNSAIYDIQASKCRWRNTFRIEVNGTDGYGIVEGRNRNYGNQTYRRGRRWGWLSGKSQKESEELVIDYDGEDSFIEETKAVLYGCEGIQPGTSEDNLRCLKFIE